MQFKISSGRILPNHPLPWCLLIYAGKEPPGGEQEEGQGPGDGRGEG